MRFFILILFSINSVFANNTADSLFAVLKKTKEPKKAEIYNSIAKHFYRIEPEKTLEYAKKAKESAVKNNNNEQKIEAELNIALYYMVTGKPDTASLITYNCITESKKIKNDYSLAISYNRYGVLNYFFFDTDSAQKYFSMAASIFEVQKNETELVKIYNNLGAIYYSKKQYNEAIKFYFKCLDIDNKNNDKMGIASDYNNISAIYLDLKEVNNSLKYSNLAYTKFSELGDIKGIINASNNLGNTYRLVPDIEKSKHYLSLSKSLSIQINDIYNLSLACNNLTMIFSYVKNFDSAYYYAKEAYNLKSNFRKPENRVSSIGNLGGVLLNLKKYDEALKYLYEANSEALKYKMYDYFVNQTQNIISIYSYKGMADSVSHHLALMQSYQDSLNNQKFNNQLLELEKKYETEKKDLKIKSQKELIDKGNIIRYALIAVILLVLIASILFYLWLKNREKGKIENLKRLGLQQIIETEEKERARIAKDLHDGIVQDLTAIKFKINSIEKTPEQNIPAELKQLYSQIDKTSKEVRDISYQMMPVTLKELGLVKALEDLFNRSLSVHNISFELECMGIEQRLPEKIEVNIYRICQELLNNSIKHSKATRINLLLMLKNNTITVTYEDNGIGFNTEKAKKGIGLTSLSSRVEMVKGSFEIDSKINSGTIAYIRIPLQ